MAKIYVGNLPFTATDADIRALFSQHGAVESVSLPTDRETGRPRGFGFVEMSQADAAHLLPVAHKYRLCEFPGIDACRRAHPSKLSSEKPIPEL